MPFLASRTADVLLSKGELKSKHPNSQIRSVVADFSNLDDVSKIPDYITSNALRVTLFINNVASVDGGLYLFSELPNDILEQTLIPGVMFFTKLCRLIVPLLESVEGKTLMANIGSAAGQAGMPYLVVYSGTKGYVTSLTRSLAVEAKMTSSNVRYLYIDLQGVSTPKNGSPISVIVPSAEHFAKSLVFSLGRRRNRNRGSDIFVTPYWGHKLTGIIFALIPRGIAENMLIKIMRRLKEQFDKQAKRQD